MTPYTNVTSSFNMAKHCLDTCDDIRTVVLSKYFKNEKDRYSCCGNYQTRNMTYIYGKGLFFLKHRINFNKYTKIGFTP